MPYVVYKAVHYLGIFSLVVILGAALAAPRGDSEAGSRRRRGILHGTALFVVLLGGFGMLARLGVDHAGLLPGWVWVKLGLWTVLGAVPFVVRRRPQSRGSRWPPIHRF